MKQFPNKNIFLQLFHLGLIIYVAVALITVVKKLFVDVQDIESQCSRFTCLGEWTVQAYALAGISALVVVIFSIRWSTSVQNRKIGELIEWSKLQSWQFKTFAITKENPENHVHCLLCSEKIHVTEDPKYGKGYSNEDQTWMCQNCYGNHIKN
ncbi:hypothetical protein [Aliikangiella coralliicola]|uniref:Uncharacterized protein n=1 Tax=Aliikangiella coralliicola TaxID=2592383 RepID=A0A545TVB2_9GAMM|nr:hypothetical protein [Aliikangiella coralliicola]TQV81101.1 hypothetical protein FLL46_26180 [Aliikangiella coralliicola]